MFSDLLTNYRACILHRLVEVAVNYHNADNDGDDGGKNASKKREDTPNNYSNKSRCYISEAIVGFPELDVFFRHIIEFWNHDSAGSAKKFSVELASLICTLKLVVAFCDALAALIAKVNQTFGTAICLRVYPPTTRRAFGLVSNSSHIICCGLGDNVESLAPLTRGVNSYFHFSLCEHDLMKANRRISIKN
jgi:hypothetical protein